MDRNDIERYHNSGKMPDWVYYQLVNDPIGALQSAREKMRNNKSRQIDNILEQPEFKKEAEKAISSMIDDLTPKNINIQMKL